MLLGDDRRVPMSDEPRTSPRAGWTGTATASTASRCSGSGRPTWRRTPSRRRSWRPSRRGSFAGRSSERTWLVGILKHKIADHYRRSARGVESRPGADPTSADFDRRGHWRVGPASWGGDPGRDLEAREFWDAFGGCLAKLPRGLADAFLLRELDGLSSAEVQQQLGITPENLWTRLHRSRSLLRRCLESNWFGRRAPSTPHRVEAKGSPRP